MKNLKVYNPYKRSHIDGKHLHHALRNLNHFMFIGLQDLTQLQKCKEKP